MDFWFVSDLMAAWLSIFIVTVKRSWQVSPIRRCRAGISLISSDS